MLVIKVWRISGLSEAEIHALVQDIRETVRTKSDVPQIVKETDLVVLTPADQRRIVKPRQIFVEVAGYGIDIYEQGLALELCHTIKLHCPNTSVQCLISKNPSAYIGAQ